MGIVVDCGFIHTHHSAGKTPPKDVDCGFAAQRAQAEESEPAPDAPNDIDPKGAEEDSPPKRTKRRK